MDFLRTKNHYKDIVLFLDIIKFKKNIEIKYKIYDKKFLKINC